MQIYVAGKWEDRHRCRRVMDRLEAAGHTITCDWTNHNYPPAGSEYMLTYYSMCDIQGVRDCDLLVCIASKSLPYRGLFVELGVALAMGHRVAIIGHGIDTCIFVQHPLVKHYNRLGRLIKDLESPSIRPSYPLGTRRIGSDGTPQVYVRMNKVKEIS